MLSILLSKMLSILLSKMHSILVIYKKNNIWPIFSSSLVLKKLTESIRHVSQYLNSRNSSEDWYIQNRLWMTQYYAKWNTFCQIIWIECYKCRNSRNQWRIQNWYFQFPKSSEFGKVPGLSGTRKLSDPSPVLVLDFLFGSGTRNPDNPVTFPNSELFGNWKYQFWIGHWFLEFPGPQRIC